MTGALKFKQKVKMSFDVGSYTVKTANSSKELIESFKLRHEVFFNEFQDLSGSGLDVDHFDFHFDHLIIIHKPTQKIIGTYRLSLISDPRKSYTALEFDLSALFNLKGPYLELGRACIHKDHRKGSVISLLWRGISEYMNISGANILFGCSSLKIDNTRDAALVYKSLLEQNFVMQDFHSFPTSDFQMQDFDTWLYYFQSPLPADKALEAQELIPSLLTSYLKLGAKVASQPAFDKDFNCIDMLTILEKNNFANSLARRFQINK
jgi:putative hemolysin